MAAGAATTTAAGGYVANRVYVAMNKKKHWSMISFSLQSFIGAHLLSAHPPSVASFPSAIVFTPLFTFPFLQ
jgi:hypothetical protein